MMQCVVLVLLLIPVVKWLGRPADSPVSPGGTIVRVKVPKGARNIDITYPLHPTHNNIDVTIADNCDGISVVPEDDTPAPARRRRSQRQLARA